MGLHRHPGEDEDWSSVYGPQYDVWAYIKLFQHLLTMLEVHTDVGDIGFSEVAEAKKMVIDFEEKNKITRSATIR